jgi:RNase P/RNase MRP subunit POP5
MTSKEKALSETSWVVVEATPQVKDPRELCTILTSSLRSLFGDLEPHSSQLTVDRADDSQTALVVKCPTESVAAVRASLTLVTPPPYLSATLYRFDVLKVGNFGDL